jgi:hypothetical protein
MVGIEDLRRTIAGSGPWNVNGRRVYGAPPGTPTTAWQQAEMLRRQGVACAVYSINNPTQLANLVRGGRRPVLLGLNFARVPDSVAGHSFQGWHAIAVLDTYTKNTVSGFLVNDPNFSPPGGPRPDKTGGKIFYPWGTMHYALSDLSANWAVVPTTPKAVVAPKITEAQEMAFAENIKSVNGRYFDCKAGTILRKGPGNQYPYHYKTERPEKFWLHGFYPNNWVYASRDRDSTGFFWVHPNH